MRQHKANAEDTIRILKWNSKVWKCRAQHLLQEKVEDSRIVKFREKNSQSKNRYVDKSYTEKRSVKEITHKDLCSFKRPNEPTFLSTNHFRSNFTENNWIRFLMPSKIHNSTFKPWPFLYRRQIDWTSY